MCELMGVSASVPTDIRALLREFYAHSVRHPHGWGLFRIQDGTPEWYRAPERAKDSTVLPSLIEETLPQTAALAHIRLATVGAIKPENCHPYHGADASGRMWTLIHNGTIYSSRRLTPYHGIQTGDTDSERVFLYLLDCLGTAIREAQRPLTAEERFAVVERFVISLAARNKLNLLIWDGELLYVHKNMEGTLCMLERDGARIVSTTPLSAERWEPVPTAQLMAYRDGAEAFAGICHGRVFVPNLAYITAAAALGI